VLYSPAEENNLDSNIAILFLIIKSFNAEIILQSINVMKKQILYLRGIK